MVDRRAYIVGAGLASLSSAAYLIRDGGVRGDRIRIIEETSRVGGSLDAERTVDGGYVMRGFRMLEDAVYSCLFDLLSFIPSLNYPNKTVADEINEFNSNFKILASSRLIENGQIIQSFPFNLKEIDRINILRLLIRREWWLGKKTIEDFFSKSFFKSNFWIQMSTTFSFQPWHSLAEFRRYIVRFFHSSQVLNTMECVRITPHNEYESIVEPIIHWLKAQGVEFVLNTRVVDMDFKNEKNGLRVERLHCLKSGKNTAIDVGLDDLVFAALGSITSDSSIGSMMTPPALHEKNGASSWQLWERLSKKSPNVGRPSVFNSTIDKTKWISFTVTLNDPAFVEALGELTQRPIGTEGVITINDSPWLLSFAMTPFPCFKDQAPETNVCWGYGLFPDRCGRFVSKKMTDCSGREILIELCSHLGFSNRLDRIIDTSICVPCLLPYVTSQFLPRGKGDRPPVIPKGITNLALLGQFCEIPDDIVFTLEYSVRSAQIGVFSLLNLDKQPTSVHKAYRNPKNTIRAIRAVMARDTRPASGRQPVTSR
ncbi:MAG: oleate hydratase [Planctomycetota bacterium]